MEAAVSGEQGQVDTYPSGCYGYSGEVAMKADFDMRMKANDDSMVG
jgi:hypothetical protein